MPAVSRKRRLRSPTSAAEPFFAASTRTALASRLLETPHLWRHATAAAGASGVDEFLCHLGRSIADAALALPESAETARGQLRELRLVVHAAIDARFDELDQRIDSAQTAKSAALERELVAVDAALGRWRTDSAALSKAFISLSDAELESHHATLSSRLDDLESQLAMLPTAVEEPPIVRLVANTSAMLTVIAGFGRVLVPLAAFASDLIIDAVPGCVWPTGTVSVLLSLGARHAAQSLEESSVVLERLESLLTVGASLESPGGVEPHALDATVATNFARRTLCLSIRVPATASAGDCIVVGVITVAGRRVAGCPLTIPVVRGMRGPLCIEGARFDGVVTPCISPDGLLFLPPGGTGPNVLVFGADGVPLPDLCLDGLDSSNNVRWAAYVQGDSPALLLAGCSKPGRILCLDERTRAVRWSVEDVHLCGGVAVLPAMGVAIINSTASSTLFIHRLSDGARTGSLVVSALGFFLASDPLTGLVFGIFKNSLGSNIHAWSCAGDGSRLTPRGLVAASEAVGCSCAVAVVPPAPGKTVSHLVVATCFGSNLRVLSLPDFTLVHTHRQEGIAVEGLAADPGGCSIAVCDENSSAIHVLPWPLPGMPPLLA